MDINDFSQSVDNAVNGHNYEQTINMVIQLSNSGGVKADDIIKIVKALISLESTQIKAISHLINWAQSEKSPVGQEILREAQIALRKIL